MGRTFIRRHIMIKERFARLVLEGRKTTTVRLGRVIPRADEVVIHSGGRPIAEAIIKNVVYKKVRELTEDDAIRDGYSSVEELLRDLKEIYGKSIRPDDGVTIIEFELVRRFDNIDPGDVYLGFPPHTIALLASRYLRSGLSNEERMVVDSLIRYRSIRTASIKLYGSPGKRWAIRKVLRNILARLVDSNIVKIDEETLEKLATVSRFWREYLESRRIRASESSQKRSS